MFASFLQRNHRVAAVVALSAFQGLHTSSSGSGSSGNSGNSNTYKVQAEAAAVANKKKTKQAKQQQELFENQCLKRQMHQPKVPYPAWDYNWDGRMTPETSLEGHRQGKARQTRGKTRHIILVRHGQYDETSPEDEHRKLTPLGRTQATRTGQRLARLAKGSLNFNDPRFRGPCPIKAIRVSDMTRAKETAQLIAKQMRNMKVETPDPGLNEALPAPMVPIRPDILEATEEIDEHQERIEEAFQRYFYRDNTPQDNENENEGEDEGEDDDEDQDEFEIIVCHGNVIRYFFCRALQLPPEAWLRMSIFNCSLTYLMIRPSGTVSARMLGDVGHLSYEESTFSGYPGFKW